MPEEAGPGRGEEPPEPGPEVPRGDDGGTPPAPEQDEEWAAADALLLGQPTVLGEPGGR